jgi:hypothetical protein
VSRSARRRFTSWHPCAKRRWPTTHPA